ncbi:hypothetical protein [Haloplanus rubicundus]|uniref:Uncharacterized protein n=1 Tax=Haloplanus rubicundus TaxID=1547898 RepID=A0A345EHN2_9EURY|nr:hypothetical protein [Haloplanus rubicundus]AXG11704.1 hypothetical protein DU484_01530 [Haloplanus rubicundus]
MNHSSPSELVSNYANIRTIPAMLSVVFAVASLYQFGGIATVELVWLSNYTLTTEHAAIASLATYVVALLSSETKSFEYYETWEQLMIGLGFAVILGDYLTTEVTDLLMQLGDPLGYQIAFVVTILAWTVTVR